MIRTILFDLDDTLLVNKMDQFLPAYFQRLGDHLADITPPERMLGELVAGTQAMLTNLDPRVSLEQSFSQHFYPALDLEEAEVTDVIKAFYREEFPRLRSQTEPIPGVPDLVDALLLQEYEIVIATNPLFPRLAVEERLRWAGLPPNRFHFRLITSYEQSHFAKPNPEYFAEILARLGRKPGEAIMVGDDLKRDIEPAASLGLAVYLTGRPEQQKVPIHASRDSGSEIDRRAAGALDLATEEGTGKSSSDLPSGPLADLPSILRSLTVNEVLETGFSPRNLLARLRAALAATLTSCSALSTAAWVSRPIEGEWATVEIIAHLRDVEREVNLPRLEAILSRNQPHLTAYDTDRWAEERAYIGQDGQTVLQEFSRARMKLIDTLESIKPEDWNRPARHALIGPTTLRELMKIATEHDWLHMAQLRETLDALSPLSPG
jgi:HAD superfamily hydrolase (TIGR01549 family)